MQFLALQQKLTNKNKGNSQRREKNNKMLNRNETARNKDRKLVDFIQDDNNKVEIMTETLLMPQNKSIYLLK